MTVIDKVKRFISNNDLQGLAKYLQKNSGLPGRRANTKLAGQVANVFGDLVGDFGFEKIYKFIVSLEKNEDEYVRLVTAQIFGAIGINDYAKVLPHLKRLADDSSWRVREGVAEGIARLLCVHFDGLQIEFYKWIKTGKPNLLRAIAVGALSMVSYDKKELIKQTTKIFKMLKLMLNVDNDYVHKGVGFAINIIGNKNPKVVCKIIKGWLSETKLNSSPLALAKIEEGLFNSKRKSLTRFGKKHDKLLASIRKYRKALKSKNNSAKAKNTKKRLFSIFSKQQSIRQQKQGQEIKQENKRRKLKK